MKSKIINHIRAGYPGLSGGDVLCGMGTTTPSTRTITQEQEYAVRHFIECWNISMPYHDIGSALNCIECNALHEMLVAMGAVEAAHALMEAHVAGDDEGDDPEHLSIKTKILRNDSV